MVDLLETYSRDLKPCFILRLRDSVVTWHNRALLSVFATITAPAATAKAGERFLVLDSIGLRDWLLDYSSTVTNTIEYYLCEKRILWTPTIVDYEKEECILITGVPLGRRYQATDQVILDTNQRYSFATTYKFSKRQSVKFHTLKIGYDDREDDLPTPDEHRTIVKDDSEYTMPAAVMAESVERAYAEVLASQSEPAESEESELDLEVGTNQDWTRTRKQFIDNPILKLLRRVNWGATALGDMNSWPQYLRTLVLQMTSSFFPVALWWGEEYVIMYNEAYAEMAGGKHPKFLGKTCADYWSEIWPYLQPVMDEVRLTGVTVRKENDRLFVIRCGFVEEAYFTYGLIPIFGDNGGVVAIYNPAFDTTKDVLAERRLQTLRGIGAQTAETRSVKHFWKAFLAAIELNPLDIPFAILYSKYEKGPDGVFELEGSLGIPQDHKNVPNTLNLTTCNSPFAAAFNDSKDVDYLLLNIGHDLAEADIEGFETRGFEESCSSVVICPIHVRGAVLGFLMLGLNPRRPFDEDYRLFIQLLTRQLTTSLATTKAFEDEMVKNEDANKDNLILSQQLAVRTKEAEMSELKFTRMADFAPVGIFIADEESRIRYINEMWSEISQRHVGHDPSEWLDSVLPEDRQIAEAGWRKVFAEKKPFSWEFRWRKRWVSSNGQEADRWALMACHPEMKQGALVGVFGCLMNISDQKLAEHILQKRVAEMAELKRQQDNFVDVASHEMRNPLSAILQCADSIVSSLLKDTVTREEMDDDIIAAQTILLCAGHQKRVVDDILTLSKLDSATLVVTEVDVKPIDIVQDALQMFAQEAAMDDIKMTFTIDPSYKELEIEHVKVDPTRVLQVLINLLTNALKSIRKQEQRNIQVRLSASIDRPVDATGLTYFSPPTHAQAKEVNENTVYLKFDVADTGMGLTDSEKKLLFHKFSQATPRTHVQYGGSGLGLFISRELVRLQGGEIGVASESGKGTTFSFFIRAQKAIVENKPPSSPPTPSQTKKSSKTRETYRILIVEDNLVNQKVVQRQLHNIGCETIVADHGLDAIDKISKSRLWSDGKKDAYNISVILMDIEMPVMDGLTAAREIRKLQKAHKITSHIPIIAVTANARPEQIKDMFAAGMDDVLSKPFRIPELIAKLDGLLLKD